MLLVHGVLIKVVEITKIWTQKSAKSSFLTVLRIM